MSKRQRGANGASDPDGTDAELDERTGSEPADGGPDHVERTLMTIEMLADEPRTVEALAAELGVHRRTVARMLESMTRRGWVEANDANERTLRLTARVLNVSGKVLQQMDLVSIARPYVAELRDLIGETSHLAVASDGWAVHVLEEPSRHPLAVSSSIGSRVPLHATAVGKALAAYLPDALARAIEHGLLPLSDRTITDPKALVKHLEEVRSLGVAIDDGEVTPEMRCIAAPVFDFTGAVVASVGFSGPATRVGRAQLESHAELVRGTAARLSALLGKDEAVRKMSSSMHDDQRAAR